jgi:hypothetical protein
LLVCICLELLSSFLHQFLFLTKLINMLHLNVWCWLHIIDNLGKDIYVNNPLKVYSFDWLFALDFRFSIALPFLGFFSPCAFWNLSSFYFYGCPWFYHRFAYDIVHFFSELEVLA